MSKKYILISSFILFYIPIVMNAFTNRPAEDVINEIIEPTCFKNGEEYKQSKEKIPEMFRQDPVLLGEDLDIPFVTEKDVFVVIKISIRDNGILHYSLNSWQGDDRWTADQSEIEKICFGSVKKQKDKRMVVKLLNGKVIVGNVNESEGKLTLWTQEFFSVRIISTDEVTNFENEIKVRRKKYGDSKTKIVPISVEN